MKNMDQTRARSALDCTTQCGAEGRSVLQQPGEGNCLSGYPSLILGNGLLPTLAFSIDKGRQHRRVANAIAYHLDVVGIVRHSDPTAETLRDALSDRGADALLLQRATDETLAFLSFLKRFAS
ncbi:MAG: type III-B CRISPR module-associated protein Cmr5 [Lentisphaeria bacterium]|nr:type III-B CRISPR module-associated protein Cmr5 [Lentisphaeria bacterium]